MALNAKHAIPFKRSVRRRAPERGSSILSSDRSMVTMGPSNHGRNLAPLMDASLPSRHPVMATRWARRNPCIDSRRNPAGSMGSAARSLVQSTTTMSRSRCNHRCWNPSSETTICAPHSSTTATAASYRRSPTTTGTPGNLRAICTGSSPPVSAFTRTRSRSATITTPRLSRPYPRLITPTQTPRWTNNRTINSTTGVLPVPLRSCCQRR